MNFYTISAFINALTSFILGCFIYSKDRKSKINQSFALFCFSVFFWSFGYYFWQLSRDETNALFWSRFLMGGAIFIPIFYLHFVLYFLNIYEQKKRILLFGYFIFIIFFFLNFTSYFVQEVAPEPFFPFWPKPGITFHYFLIFWLFYVGYSTYLLIKGYKESKGIKRLQISYILFGMTIGFLGGSINYLPWYGISIPPLTNFLVSVYVIMVTIAILKYNLMNIKVIAAELLTLTIITVLVFQLLFSKNFLEVLLRFIFLILVAIFGFLLIRSINIEVHRREQLQELTKKLKEANKKLKKLDEAKSEFISIASHQLRTPLSIIKGYISMIMEGDYGKVDRRLADPMSKIYISNERLIHLVDNLLDISRIESGRMQYDFAPVQLEEIIEGIISDLKMRTDDKGLYLKFIRPTTPLPRVRADASKIHEIVMNLIDNAIKYTERGGVTISLKSAENKVILCVADTGVGVTKEESKIIFNKFMRGEGGVLIHAGGAGLGLFIAKKVITDHGGEIWVESKGRGKGSKFCFSLPVA